MEKPESPDPKGKFLIRRDNLVCFEKKLEFPSHSAWKSLVKVERFAQFEEKLGLWKRTKSVFP